MDYNVTVELDAELDEEARDNLVDYLVQAGLHPALHTSGFGTDAVTVTVDDQPDGSDGLIDAAERAVDYVAFGTPTAHVRTVTALPTTLFDERAGLDAEPPMLSVPQAADRLGVSEQRVRQLLASDPPKLAGQKVGRDWLVDAASVTARLGG